MTVGMATLAEGCNKAVSFVMKRSIKISDLVFSSGAQCGLLGPTARCRWTFSDKIDNAPDLTPRLRTQVKQLWPHGVMHGSDAIDWPQGFVRSSPAAPEIALWAVALSVAIQHLAGDPVGGGRVIQSGPDHFVTALPWHRKDVLGEGMKFAARHLMLWLQSPVSAAQADELLADFQTWLGLVQPGGLAPNTFRFAMAARRRGLPVNVRTRILQLGWGCNMEWMDSSFTGRTGCLATNIARNKPCASQWLREGGVPVPPAGIASQASDALKLARKLGWPVVVKPSNRDQGEGVVPGIRDEPSLQLAYEAAAKLSPGSVIVEKHIPGDDHRMLVVGGRLLAATRRIPGGVTGDGKSTLTQLLDEVNADPRRGTDKRSLLIALALDQEAMSCLTEQGLTASSIPEAGCFVPLRRTANISRGGTAVDVTDQVHPDNRLIALRAARLVGLDIAGVDFLCPDISRSWREVGGAVCEVNAQPGFRPHWLAQPERDINGEIIDGLFRSKPARIPTAAITGTNGKSTTARMLHHIWRVAGKNAGVCTSHGVWVGDDRINDENLSGYPGGNILLGDPSVESAIIEMPRKGLMVFGHPCDRYDVAALLNVQNDHVGRDGIQSLEQMARLKAEVLERATHAIVVNAEDPLCLAMRSRTRAKHHILVATDARTPALIEHLEKGGSGVFEDSYEGASWIILAEGTRRDPLMPLAEIPATMNGLLRFNEINALFASALAWAQGIAPATIRRALSSFTNSCKHNPGRYNFIEGFSYQILLDYAHNLPGLSELCKVVDRLPVQGQRRLTFLKLGNRQQAHIDEVNEMAACIARTFDHIIVGANPELIRRSSDWSGEDPVAQMQAYWLKCLLDHGVPERAIALEPDEKKAVSLGLASAQAGDLLVLIAGPWQVLPVLGR